MRYGLGWRAELGAGIIAHLDRIDVVEVMAEDFFEATRAQRRALTFLKSQVPIVLHATSLGLASSERVDARKLAQIARVIEWLEPELWSEHLAFVRGGGAEVGHLAAPPRNEATLAGLVRNVEEARRVTGSLPLLENVASLIEPPLCAYDERAWLHAVLDATACDLLLDLHNVHANACNFGFSAEAVVASLPAHRVRMIHLAGGRRIERNRLLDDHLHAVPDEVFALLSCVTAGEAMVVLERDGNYPPIEELLAELDRARAIPHASPSATPAQPRVPPAPAPRNIAVPAFMARLYTDEAMRERFLLDPQGEARAAGFDEREARELARVDADDLRLAARGFAKKRARQSTHDRTH